MHKDKAILKLFSMGIRIEHELLDILLTDSKLCNILEDSIRSSGRLEASFGGKVHDFNYRGDYFKEHKPVLSGYLLDDGTRIAHSIAVRSRLDEIIADSGNIYLKVIDNVSYYARVTLQ